MFQLLHVFIHPRSPSRLRGVKSYGPFRSRKFGLTIDNLVSAELITADGRTRTVSADQEPDFSGRSAVAAAILESSRNASISSAHSIARCCRA
jgi:hypothetical protein